MSPPRSLTQLLDVPIPELVARTVAGDLDLPLHQLHAVVAEHALRIEATGSRRGLLEAAESLHELAEWAAAKGEDLSWVRVSAKCEQLGEHLTDRAARSDPIGVEALLRGRRGKPRQLLALLADAPGGSLPRSVLAAPLETGDSHVSHILRALNDAGLVHRHQEGREVTVTLSERGREFVGVAVPQDIAGPRVKLPPEAVALLHQLPLARRRQLEGRETLAPVIDLPRRAAVSS